jgi:hypothetical protein
LTFNMYKNCVRHRPMMMTVVMPVMVAMAEVSFSGKGERLVSI